MSKFEEHMKKILEYFLRLNRASNGEVIKIGKYKFKMPNIKKP